MLAKTTRACVFLFFSLSVCLLSLESRLSAQQQPTKPDFLRQLQLQAVESKAADWIHWGDRPDRFSNWTGHSNRLIPVYCFGVDLSGVAGANSVYRSEEGLRKLYGKLPLGTLNPDAEYFDQTDLFHLQQRAFAAGKKHVILMVFDGMDWQTTQAAAVYKNQKIVYTTGRGTGLSFQDYRGTDSQFGFCVTSPHHNSHDVDVDSQTISPDQTERRSGGYSAEFGGATPWSKPGDPSYLMGQRKNIPHIVPDSAATATSMTTGQKTYNAAINIGIDGSQLETIAHRQQRKGFAIGVVTSVPICHATPACAYAHNVSRNDYQDISRDLVGLKSASHRTQPLAGVDVLIGAGWGENNADDRKKQGNNYEPGNPHLTESDLKKIDVESGGRYVVATRTAKRNGAEVLQKAADQAAENCQRLLGFFGVDGGHLPYQTADGNFNPTRGISKGERYTENDISENPTLAQMTAAALQVLEKNETGFWLMVEAGDVDWANHNNNIDDSIGAVLSGEAAFDVVIEWVEKNSNWDETAVIVTADHGHMLVIKDLSKLIAPEDSQEVVKE